MKRRGLSAAAVVLAASAACVDLFHSTSFDTLCTKDPSDPSCTATDGGGDGGDGAAASHPDFCTWGSSLAKRKATSACAWLGACEGPLDSTRFGNCVVRAQLAFDCGANPSLRPRGEADALWGCLAEATSCAAVDACIFPAGKPVCPKVESGSFTTCVSPSIRAICASPGGGAPAGVEICSLTGRTCTARNQSVAECTGPQANNCPKDGCSGTAATRCGVNADRQTDRGIDCADFGAGRCANTDAGPACAPPGDAGPCTTDAGEGAVVCTESDVARTCSGGLETKIDCAKLGMHCDPDASAPPFDPVLVCGATDISDTCSGDDTCIAGTLTSCGLGSKHQVVCSAVGLGACEVLPSGYGQCTLP